MELQSLVAAVADASGVYLEGVTVKQHGRTTLVRVVVDAFDGPDGVGSEQLAEVSRAVAEALDEADVVAGPYTLEVSTPGVDRPLTQERHFRRAVTRLVKVTWEEGTFTDRLREVRDGLAVFEEHEVPLSMISHARVQIELK